MTSILPPTISHYSIFTDDSGYPIHSNFIDYRDPIVRTSVTTLVKSCEKQYAFEDCGTICISKPAKYRHFGETLVNDPAEAKHTRTIQAYEVVDDSDELAAANASNEELNRMARLTDMNFQMTTRSTTTRHEESSHLTFDRNGWIYCASIEPEGPKEKELLENSFRGNDYNHKTLIHRPFEFALALGSMVVEQLGPQLHHAKTRISFPGQDGVEVTTKGQMIVHGPVIYVDDPYEVVLCAVKEYRDLYLPFFVKSVEFQDQQEYRYVVLTDQEPTNEIKILRVSPAMAGTTREHPNPQRTHPIIQHAPQPPPSENETSHPLAASSYVQHKTQSTQLPSGVNKFPSLSEAFADPTTTVLVSKDNTVTNALRALRTRLSPILGDVPQTEVAAAAYHAEPCMIELYEVFQNPVESISIEDNDLIVLNINFPPESNARAKTIFGPTGKATLELHSPIGKSATRYYNSWTDGCRDIAKKLKAAGLPLHKPQLPHTP